MPTKRATVRGVNNALRLLGYLPYELEFVRGEGYFYLAGDIGYTLYSSGLHGIGCRVSDFSCTEWVGTILSHVVADKNFRSLSTKAQSKITISLGVDSW